MMTSFGQGTDNPARIVGLFRTHGDPPYAEGRGPGLDLLPAKTVMAPARYSCDPQRQVRSDMFMWTSPGGPLQLRVRSGEAYAAGNAFYERLPTQADLAAGAFDPAYSVFSREHVAAKAKDKIFATGSTWDTVGRLLKAVPRRGSVITHPVTRAEARRALRNCGLDIASQGTVPGPLLLADLRQPGRFMINTHSDNGCPVGGKWDTPGAADLCESLALAFEVQLRNLRHKTDAGVTRAKVQEHMRGLMDRMPWLVAFTGKCKGDYYSLTKIRDAGLRFYNVVPRHLALNMQTVTKPLGAVKTSVLQGGHSAMGVSMHHGGAAAMVARMQVMLDDKGYAYVHVGDDTFFAMKRRDGRVVMWSADCSNFDLTQHGDMTKEVHLALFDMLALIEPGAAALWYALARERLVTCFGGGAFIFQHCGPSGLQLQSYVNDMIMQVFCERLTALIDPDTVGDRAALDTKMREVAVGLGLTVRLEDYAATDGRTLQQALAQVPFLFIGYYFHTDPVHGVTVCADVARTLSQLRYPKAWEKNQQVFRTKEVVRLASIGLNLGMPLECLREAFFGYQWQIGGRLAGELDRGANLDPGALHWMQVVTETGPDPQGTMRGLQAAVERVFNDPASLWVTPAASDTSAIPDLGGESTLVGLDGEAAVAALSWPPKKRAVLILPIATTHPVTDKNWARPAPTARWGPNKPPRPPPSAADALAALSGRLATMRANTTARYKRSAMEFFSDDFSVDEGPESDDLDRYATGYE